MSEHELDRRIAVIGMSGRFPGAPDLESFWDAIAGGRDCITRFDADEGAGAVESPREGERYVRARGLLDGVEDFDLDFFEFTPAEAALVDPQHRLWLEVAWEALEAAGYAHDRHDQIVSMYAGSFPSTYLYANLLPDRAALDEFVRLRRAQSFALLVQNDPAFLPTRAAYKLNLRGPAVNVQTACSTSLVAVAMAVQSLVSLESDVAVAGGVCVAVPQRTGYFVQDGSLHSRDGTCRPYDAAACGTVFGNGAGAVVLKRLANARRDGDPIHAVILGAAVNNDGRAKVSYAAPSVQGQAEVIATAQILAGVSPEDIGYVEGHGTATPMGDPIEVQALKLAFGAAPLAGSCCLGSAKGNVGHLDAAAGVTGLIRTVLALQRGRFPATAHYERPNPELHLDGSPFFVTGRTLPWPRGARPRRAGVSSFGIGGTNAHVVLEEWPEGPDRSREAAAPEQTVLVLSARSRAALDAATGRLAEWVDGRCASGRAPRPLSEVAAALQRRRKLFTHRRAVRVSSWADARDALRNPERWDTGTAVEGQPRLVFAFPGQGSLQPGALAQLLREEPDLSRQLDELARPASELAGFDLAGWLRDRGADATALRQDNAKAQLAIFCVDAALARWLEGRGVRADAFLGHSLGEWVGAHLAGALGVEDALFAVWQRGRLMQETGPGAALAVRLSEVALAPYLDDGATLACVNAPELCLVSGRPDAVERCARKLQDAGVTTTRIPIDVAVHSPAMDVVVEPFHRVLAGRTWREPDRPLLSPVTGTWLSPQEATDLAFWAAQPRRIVRFDAAVATLLREPRPTVVLEVGIGAALTGLVGAQLRHEAQHRALPVLGSPGNSGAWPRQRLPRALGELWAAGVDVDLVGEVPVASPAPVLPTYPFQRRRCWRDPPVPSRQASAREPSSARARPADAVASAPGSSASERVTALVAEMSGLPREALVPSARLSSLGLDSLFMVRLAEELTARTGIRVTFARMSELNTIEKLATLFAVEAPTPPRLAAPPDTASAAPAFNGLVTLRPGDGRLPLLLIHGDLANDLLPPFLPQEQPIHAWLHQGSDGERVLLRSVEAVAQRCVEEWSATVKGAPCVVAGHSFGGLVAHEVTRRLLEAGHRVELLLLLDTPHPRVLGNLRPFGPRRLVRSVRLARDHLGFYLDIARARVALALKGRVPPQYRSPYVVSEYELAARRFAPASLDVDALLFQAIHNWCDLPDGGWLPGEFRSLSVVQVPGDHLSMVRSTECFALVGEAIGRRMRDLRAGTGAGAAAAR